MYIPVKTNPEYSITCKYNDKEYKYLTIHSAKGLEEDFVILLNVSNSTYGLPNKIENHNILSYVSSKEDDYPFAEERRVFFVAITRCKFKTYLMVPKNNPSIFIEEIKKTIYYAELDVYNQTSGNSTHS